MPVRGAAGTEGCSRSARRRPHRKSKAGCADCRRRRVKCDEKRPVCGACERRGSSCVWRVISQQQPDETSLNSPASRSTSTNQSRPPQPSRISPQSIPSAFILDALDSFPQTHEESESGGSVKEFDLDDLALLHHWYFVVSGSICLAKGEIDLWTRVFPEVGFEYPFVNHAILSVSALHLACGTSESASPRQNMNRALAHHISGLRSFRKAITSITVANSEALFIWSVLNIIYVLGMVVHKPGPDDTAALTRDKLLGAEWVPMLHGIGAVTQPMHEYLSGGRMATFTSLGNWFELDLDRPSTDKADAQLLRLQSTWKGSPDAETYDASLQVLRRCRRFVLQFEGMADSDLAKWGYNQAWSGPLIFIHLAPKGFFTLLRQRQPPALLLFSYFGALLYGLRSYWFIGDLGKRIIELVEDLLGQYWRPLMGWPLDCIGFAQ